jgi:hypothetical protein
MRELAISLTVLGFFTGVGAVVAWWRASKITPDPDWRNGMAPVVQELEQLGWNVAFSKAFQQSGKLNQIAAILTAVAVLFSTAASLISLLQPAK